MAREQIIQYEQQIKVAESQALLATQEETATQNQAIGDANTAVVKVVEELGREQKRDVAMTEAQQPRSGQANARSRTASGRCDYLPRPGRGECHAAPEAGGAAEPLRQTISAFRRRRCLPLRHLSLIQKIAPVDQVNFDKHRWAVRGAVQAVYAPEFDSADKHGEIGRIIMKQMKIILIVLAIAALFCVGPYNAFKWSAERVYVEPGSALMVINKFGDPLPPDMIVVPAGDNRYKGIQEELRGPGRYFLNPVEYDWHTVPLVEIPAGDPEKWEWDENGKIKDPTMLPKVGIVTLKQGKTAPIGMEVVDRGFKGVQKEVLTPGIYKINPQEYEVTQLADAVVGAAGERGRGDETRQGMSRRFECGRSSSLAIPTQPANDFLPRADSLQGRISGGYSKMYCSRGFII